MFPELCKNAGKRKLQLIVLTLSVHTCVCMWPVNFRNFFWEQELKGDNNEFSFLSFPGILARMRRFQITSIERKETRGVTGTQMRVRAGRSKFESDIGGNLKTFKWVKSPE